MTHVVGLPIRLVIIDDDQAFRTALEANLIGEGFAVTSHASGEAGLLYLEAGDNADVVLLDWHMPDVDGLEVLRQLRRRGNRVPVVLLTGHAGEIYEETALQEGAVDFIDKSRRLSILVKRINLILEGLNSRTRETPVKETSIEQGALTLNLDTGRAFWHGQQLLLTLTEFNILVMLAAQPGKYVPYREIYDQVHGRGFVAGYGDEGYRVNVRTFIKRIRHKFRAVDPNFDRIANWSGFGYRWVPDTEKGEIG